MKKLLLSIFSVMALNASVNAQCTNATAYVTAAAPAPSASFQLAGCQFASEYSTLTGVVIGNTYSTTSTVPGDYITIRSGTFNGPVVAFGQTPLNWVATAAGNHFVHSNSSSTCGTASGCRNINVGCYPAGIPNDLCANPFVVSAPGLYTGTTIGALVESPVPPSCITSAPSQGGVWYTLTGNGNRIGLSLCSSGWDSKIWVYTGACGSNVCVTGNDDNGPLCGGAAASVVFCSQVGVQYRILVAGFSGPSAFALAVTQTVVAAGATPIVTASQNPICNGQTATLTATGAPSYTWNPGALTGAVQSFSPAASQVYSVTAGGVDAGTGCPNGGTALFTLTVNPSPTVAVAGGAICSGNSFTLSPSGATSYTYSSGPVVTPIANASYTVTGTTAGCSSSAVASVTVNATPTVVVAGGSICAGNSFTLSPSGATSYTYSSGPVVTPIANASYTVTGTTAGCSSNAVASVTVNATPTVVVAGGAICSGNSFTLSPSGATSYSYSSGPVVTPIANASYTVTGTTAGCSSSAVASVTVNATPTVVVAGGAICTGNSFTLSPSGATSYTYSTGPVVTPTANASYTVTGSAANGCSGNAVASVSVNANPTVTAVSSLSLICNGQTASLTASGASTYSWNTSATTSVVAVSPSVTTSYTVTGTSNGCSNSATITQSVSACTGLNNNVASTIGTVVYPNPNTGLFTIELNNGSVKTIEVMDLTGRIVLTNTSSNDKIDFNISNLANGVYYVRVQSNNSVEVIKIVKQ